MESGYLTTGKIEKQYGVSRYYLTQACKRGELSYKLYGRMYLVDLSELKEWIRNHHHTSKQDK